MLAPNIEPEVLPSHIELDLTYFLQSSTLPGDQYALMFMWGKHQLQPA
jgi:hypothetical protein